MQAGALHYFRLPHPDLWSAALARIRVSGLNTVVLPVPWSYHCPAPGFVDFTGPRDLPHLLDRIDAAGLWLVASLGPWLGLGLDSGGLPPWLSRSSFDAATTLSHLAEWWTRLLPHFVGCSVLSAFMLDSAYGALGGRPRLELDDLVPLIERNVPGVPLYVRAQSPGPAGGHHHFVHTATGRRLRILETAGPDSGRGVAARGGAPRTLVEDRTTEMLLAHGDGTQGYVLNPAHEGVNWGCWSALESPTRHAEGAPLGRLSQPDGAFHSTRRVAMALETAGPVNLASGGSEQPRGGPASQPGEHSSSESRFSIRGATVTTRAMAAVLRTTVAGRSLVVLVNEGGGQVSVSGAIGVRHQRGALRVERSLEGMAVHFGPGKLASAVLELPDRQALQLLALDLRLAGRVWPLDAQWRPSPVPPAEWTPPDDDPARGLVIGPDLVIPQRDGGFRLWAGGKGFGYRWGPWQGSDPDTWLAPFTWAAASGVRLPSLVWASRPGSPEARGDYDDGAWRTAGSGSPPPTEALGLDQGFIWYRGHFDGMSDSVTLACRHACDVFLNGDHVASLSPPPDHGVVAAKKLPLPRRLMRDHNVLALLAEHRGRRESGWGADGPHGVTKCELGTGSLLRWRVRAGLVGQRTRQGFSGYASWSTIPVPAPGAGDTSWAVTWHRAAFDLAMDDDQEADVCLHFDQTPTRNYIYLNGHLIGRMIYPRAEQRRFWLPTGLLLRSEENELLVAQWTRGGAPGIGHAILTAGNVAKWHRVSPS